MTPSHRRDGDSGSAQQRVTHVSPIIAHKGKEASVSAFVTLPSPLCCLCSHESVSSAGRSPAGRPGRGQLVAARLRRRPPQPGLLLRGHSLSRRQSLQLRGGDVRCVAGGSQECPQGNSSETSTPPPKGQDDHLILLTSLEMFSLMLN